MIVASAKTLSPKRRRLVGGGARGREGSVRAAVAYRVQLSARMMMMMMMRMMMMRMIRRIPCRSGLVSDDCVGAGDGELFPTFLTAGV